MEEFIYNRMCTSQGVRHMKQIVNKVGLLIIGDEILLGRRVDKHFIHALEYFKERGLDISWVYFVGDDAPQLKAHIQLIRDRGDMCFCFGGIGATPDDLTRQAVADAHDLKLVRHPDAVKLIENQFGAGAYPNRILMADLPEGAELIPNEFNNIPGFFIGTIYCLPGFPEMAWPMMDWVMKNHLKWQDQPGQFSKSIGVFDARESELITLLETAQKQHPDVKLSSLPRFPAKGKWRVELGVRGSKQQVIEVLEMLRVELLKMGFRIDENPS